MNVSLREAVHSFYNELEGIGQRYGELSDSDVSDLLHRAISYYFVWHKPVERIPVFFGMFTKEGNQEISNALVRFVTTACATAEAANVEPGSPRLAALQDPAIRTNGGLIYDELIGCVDSPLPPDPLPPFMFVENGYRDPH